MRIIIVCGAGASSTFVALRVRRAAASRGRDDTALAVPLDGIDAALADADVLLLGAHCSAEAADIERRAGQAGAGFAVMPESMVTSTTGDAALDLAFATAGASR